MTPKQILRAARMYGYWSGATVEMNSVGILKFAEVVMNAERLKEREACARVCEKKINTFLSPRYATGQPWSSFNERFAAQQCAEAIRERGEK
jgi:hypothetical protein